ncbi:MAG: PAS domain S-box protein [Bacteroidota bacterium]
MYSIAYDQILIILIQCFIVAALLLTLFKLRSIFGLGLLFTALGVFQYMQVFLSSTIYIEIMPEIFVSPGSMVLFTGSIFAILLIYIREDAQEARKVIYALVAANFAMTLLNLAFGWSVDSAEIKNIYNLPSKFFTQNAYIIISGTVLLFLDTFFIIFIYEFVSKYFKSLFLRILLSALLILAFDSVVFSTFAFAGTEDFSNILISGLISKFLAAFIYSVLFTFYLLYIDKYAWKSKFTAVSYIDIFNTLTYRQKYEIVSKEIKFKDIALKESEIKHKISEEKFRSIFELSPDAISLTNQEGTIINCNQTLIHMFGFEDKSEVIGQNFGHLFAEEDLHKAINKQQMAMSGVEIKNEEFILSKKDGTLFPASISATFIAEDDQYEKYILDVIRDISESKKAEENLKNAHERLTDTLESMSDGFVSLNNDWIYTYVNRKAGEMFNRKPENLLGKHIWTEFPEGIDQPFYKTYHKVIETQKQISFEDYYQPWDRWFENHVIPTKDGLAIFFQEITGRKKVEIALRESQAFNQSLLETSPDIIYVYDIVKRENVYSNTRISDILGFSEEEIKLMGENLLRDLIHPDDFNYYLNTVIPHYQKAEDKEIIIHEYRMKHKNGNWIWLESKETIFARLNDGEPKQIFGISSNINDRKKVEYELKKYREQLEDLVSERTKELELKNNLLEKVNKAFVGRELRMAELKKEIEQLKIDSAQNQKKDEKK